MSIHFLYNWSNYSIPDSIFFDLDNLSEMFLHITF
jgi:hypothetical protein